MCLWNWLIVAHKIFMWYCFNKFVIRSLSCIYFMLVELNINKCKKDLVFWWRLVNGFFERIKNLRKNTKKKFGFKFFLNIKKALKKIKTLNSFKKLESFKSFFKKLHVTNFTTKSFWKKNQFSVKTINLILPQ